MSVIINNPVSMTYTEELEDTPPDIFEGLSFEILGRTLIITPFQGCQMVLAEDEVEAIQQGLLNFLNTGRFDQEG